jgi:large conductance mechanosensitive channel
MLSGFKKFILRGNVVDLAVGVVVGVSFGAVVTALVKDIITPFIGAFGGQPDFSALQFTINNSKFLVGDFLNALISFLINSAVIYFFVVLPVNKLAPKKESKASTKTCPECLSSVPLKAKRCPFCTTIYSSRSSQK